MKEDSSSICVRNILTSNFDVDPFSFLRHNYKSNAIHYYFNDDDSINKAASPKQ